MSQGKGQKGEKTPPNLNMFLKGFWYTKCRFTRVEIKLFQARNLRNPFYAVNLRHRGLQQMGSCESCWGEAGEEPPWHPIPVLHQPMDGNMGWCLGYPPHGLVSWAKLTFVGALGAGDGRRFSLLQTRFPRRTTSPGLKWQQLTVPARFTRDY